jgi:hypothetical protein
MKNDKMSIYELIDSKLHITFTQLKQVMIDYNDCLADDFIPKCTVSAVIVYKGSSFEKSYSEKERSYLVTNNNKMFRSGVCGNSLFADCLDGRDLGVNLEWYRGEWVVDYCYFVKNEND